MSIPFYIDCALQNKWTVWYHKQEEPNWNVDSYMKIYEFSSLLEYARFKNSFPFLPQFLNGYYFFMADDIPPQWENPMNCGGGCYNIPIPKDITEANVWIILEQAIRGDLLVGQPVSGISIVPKKYNAIVKVWNSDRGKGDLSNLNVRLTNIKTEDIYYRGHTDNNHFGQVSSAN